MVELFELDSRQKNVIYELVQSGASVPLEVTGSSMMPFLKPNSDVVWLKKSTEDSFSFGNILLFERADGSIVLHRIRKVLKDGRLVMNGDSQPWCETVCREQVIACVYKIRKGGKSVSCNSLLYKLKNILWYPTLHFRPFMKKIKHKFRRK